MLFSSLLQVSSPSRFINDGDRYNNAALHPIGTFIQEGFITGVVGPRFEIEGRMDWQFMLVDSSTELDTQSGSIESIIYNYYFKDGLKWLNFKQIKSLAEDELNKRYVWTSKGYFDKTVYGKRIRLAITTYILDANDRAREIGKNAYLYVTGWGLGKTWIATSVQKDIFVTEFFNVLQDLLYQDRISHISRVKFAYIDNNVFESLVSRFKYNDKITFSNDNSNPASISNFSPEDNLILFVSYPWDGNSYPGNEYWHGKFFGSGDPAAACFSTIAEMHNPQINLNFMKRIQVFP